ncbi:MAG TPA: methyltransferase domain-containing protein [Propionibacteriaceae bacterium]
MTAPLPFGLTAEALSAASAEADPDSLAAATRLRGRFGPELATAALHQASLRLRARTKFGSESAEMFFTRAGLEQATRPDVAAHHARRMVDAGARRVVDLGCGIGSDALAFVRAGLEVLAVDLDPDTAAVARANLTQPDLVGLGTVICADAADVMRDQLRPGDAVFCDPARRSDRGRLWRVEDFTPDWSLVTGLLDGSRVAGVKLGPALPHSLIPAAVQAQWVSHRSEVVEVALWSGPGTEPGRRSAYVWPDHELVTVRPAPELAIGPVGRYLFEPDGAVIRAGGVGQLGESLAAHLLDPQIAYLCADTLTPTPYAAAFEVVEVLPFAVKAVKRWCREQEIGTLEIKKRGVDFDPAVLRPRLGLRGANRATLVVSRTQAGAVAVVTRRIQAPYSP